MESPRKTIFPLPHLARSRRVAWRFIHHSLVVGADGVMLRSAAKAEMQPIAAMIDIVFFIMFSSL